jgi:acyl-CoA thioesterase
MSDVLEITDRERQLVQLRNVDAAMMPFGHTLGFSVESVADGEAVVVMHCDKKLHNVLNYTHGGAIFSIADTAIGLAHLASLESHQITTTIESKVSFLRPVLGGDLKAHAHCIKAGRTLSLFECDVYDSEGKLAARASATMMTLQDERCEGRLRLYAAQPESRNNSLNGERS